MLNEVIVIHHDIENQIQDIREPIKNREPLIKKVIQWIINRKK